MTSGPFMANWWRKTNGNSDRLYFLGLQNHCRWWLQTWNKKMLFLERKAMTDLDSILKSRDITLPTKAHIIKPTVFLVVIYRCKSWTTKKAECWRTDVFELWCWRRLLRVPWTAKEIKPVNPKENQHWIFIGRTNAEAEAPILWPPNVKSWFIGKDPDAGKYWRQEEKGVTEDKIDGWHHWLNGHEFEQTPRDSGQGSLVCCSPWGRKKSDMNEQLNNSNKYIKYISYKYVFVQHSQL